MKHIKRYKVFESLSPGTYTDTKEVEDIKDIVLPIKDEGLITNVEYLHDMKTGLAKKLDKWKSVPGSYYSIYIAIDSEQETPFNFTETIYETILDINSYMDKLLGIKEDGYNIEYYYETSPIKEEYTIDDCRGGTYTFKVGDHVEDSFYSIDELNDFSSNKQFVYISVAYKVN